MSDVADRVRVAALALPETQAREERGETTFFVAGEPFVRAGDTVRVRDEGGGWSTLDLNDDPDWTVIEDRIAASWELAAPRGLLEAGGR